MKKNIRYFLYLGFISLGFSACSDPPPPSLLYADRQMVDSLYQLKYKEIADSLDANCEEMKLVQLDAMVDSLLKIRLVEIIKQKQRYQQKK